MFAFFLESVGGGEWLVLLAVILIVVGPKNLPSAARKMGKVMSQLRRAADEFKRQLMSMDEEMKKAGEELKKEYVDIPDDSASPYPGHGGPDGPASDETADAAGGTSDSGYTTDYPPDDNYSDGDPYGPDYAYMHEDAPEASSAETASVSETSAAPDPEAERYEHPAENT